MLRVLHTADWHVGRSFDQFEPEDARKLARERLSVVDRILRLADQYDVHAVLCAGDLFDSPNPAQDWWDGLAKLFGRRGAWTRPVVLLPGNHDPLTADSVYNKTHPFRSKLPNWVHVVDREDFQLALSNDAVVYGAPCTSTAGDKDLALALPARGEDDVRLRIGLVHGSTFDIEGYATNFPICQEAPEKRGLDYLALGDLHSFREIPKGAVAPLVYPSAPEPTSFKERDAGYVALVWFTRHGQRPRIEKERVARWTWLDKTVSSMVELRSLAESEDLPATVLRLRLNLTVSLAEKKEVEDILSKLRGTEATNARTGAFVCDRTNLRLRVDTDSPPDPDRLPAAVHASWVRLSQEAKTSEEAKRALVILQDLLQEVQ
jgi:DNA repair exonuclease SbcCD nuclease subunit